MNLTRFARKILSLALAVAMLAAAWIAAAPANIAYADNTSYYVDSVNGNDSNNGLSQAAPWRTVSKVNAKTNYLPGDKILFKAGGVWTGSLQLRSSGAEGNPIVVGSYGEGPKPVINANAAYAAINLENIQYITLQDLELTNYKAAEPDDYQTGYYRRSGIWIKAFHNGPMRGITIRNMEIHDVTGMSVTGETTVTTTDGKDKGVNKNSNAAIQIEAWEWETNRPKAYYDGLVIEDNYIHEASTIGINIAAFSSDPVYFNRNVTVRGNSIINNGADGIVIGATANPLFEHNVSLDAGAYGRDIKWIAGMWVWRTDRALVQYNEVGRVRGAAKSDTDSTAFDTDIATRGTHIYQYNYSHGNEGGFYMDMGQLKNGINIIRYNISQNDKRNAIRSNTINTSDPALIYNNVFYNDLGIGIQVNNNPNATFMNNVFYSVGPAPITENYSAAPRFINNAFYGQPAPAQGLNNRVGDPGFVNPGQGQDGIGTLEGYKLLPNSPLIGAGKAVGDNGGRDFWNNPVYTGLPDIGVYEDPNSLIDDAAAPDQPAGLQVTAVTDTTVSLSWTAVENGVPLDGDIYNADTDELLATVIAANQATVTGLAPAGSYSFYVVAKDNNWNESAPSATVAATTKTAVYLDNTDAAASGSWTAATGGNAYNNNYIRASAGSGANTVRWTPNIPVAGYYSVYYFLPDGSDARAGNAPFTVSSAGGTKTYKVNQKARGGSWMLLGIHRFNQGASGYVQVSDAANGEVAADAVKFVHNEDFGLDDLVSVRLLTEKLQLRVGESTAYTVMGVAADGLALDLTSDGAALQYQAQPTGVVQVGAGSINGLAEGQAVVRASFSHNGNTIESSPVELYVGPRLSIDTPAFADADGSPLSELEEGVITVSSRVLNSTEQHVNATLIAVLYSPAGLVEYKTQEAVINKYDNRTLSVSVTVPAGAQGYSVKAFIWDNLHDMTPLTGTVTLQ
ncbi:MAG: hypothetical protein K0R57_1962 [Paenibacillaceae bacterium]|jgi:hypothetical protein|nr:hypothetical protein [Paenibacillaceae bacterium]